MHHYSSSDSDVLESAEDVGQSFYMFQMVHTVISYKTCRNSVVFRLEIFLCEYKLVFYSCLYFVQIMLVNSPYFVQIMSVNRFSSF